MLLVLPNKHKSLAFSLPMWLSCITPTVRTKPEQLSIGPEFNPQIHQRVCVRIIMSALRLISWRVVEGDDALLVCFISFLFNFLNLKIVCPTNFPHGMLLPKYGVCVCVQSRPTVFSSVTTWCSIETLAVAYALCRISHYGVQTCSFPHLSIPFPPCLSTLPPLSPLNPARDLW